VALAIPFLPDPGNSKGARSEIDRRRAGGGREILMNKTGLTLTVTGFAIPSTCAVQDLLPRADSLTDLGTEKVQDYDPKDELAGAAFLLVVAFAGFVCVLPALIWVIVV
jgi:hypothetical protein